MQGRNALVVAGAGLLGLLVGYALGGSGDSGVDELASRQDALAASVAALSDGVGAVDARIGSIEAAVTELGTKESERVEGVLGRMAGLESSLGELGSAQSERISGLMERIEGMGADVSGAVSGIGSTVSQALSGDLDELRAKVASIGGSAGGSEPAAPAVSGEAIGIGRTASFGDDAVRVFLSGVDMENARARVAINGSSTSALELGTPVTVGNCALTLTGFSEGGALVAADCGGDAAAAPAASGAGSAVPMGKAEIFGDGKVRVFLSAVDAEAGTARVAINGPAVTTLEMSSPVKAGDCTVELTGVGEGTATVDVAC
jgi:hypothetical protein